MLRTTALPANIAVIYGADSQADSRKRLILGGALFLLLAATMLLYSPVPDDPAYWPSIGIGTAIASLCMVALTRAFGFGWQSAPVAYIAFVWMFHFPLTLLVHLVPDLQAELPDPISGWTQDPDWYRASIYALMCVIAFVIGSGLVSAAGRTRQEQAFDADAAKFHIGNATAVAGVGWLYYLLIRDGGPGLFGNSYTEMFTSVYGSGFSIAISLVSVGCFIALMSAPRRLLWLPFVLQAAGSLPVLLTGSRQAGLIGPLVLVVLLAKRGLRMGLVRTGTACVLILWLISYVGETRSHGVVEGVTGNRSVGPVNALLEMGASLQTTSLALDWIRNGDPYLLGGSYWLPIERGLGLLLPLRTDLATDPRAINMIMVSRTSGLGGSAVAESYYNFAAFGVLFFLLLGYLLARMEVSAVSTVSTALMGVVLYAFLYQARNWFISVPMLVFVGSLPVLACRYAEFIARRRDARANGGLGFRAAGGPDVPPENWPHGKFV